MCHAGLDTVRISPVPMIVESPDHHVVVANKRLFIGEHRIVALFEIACLIQMAVESGLVSDDEILAGCGGALDDIERGHHGHGDSGNGCVGISGLEGVNSRLTPRHANILLNPFNDGLSSELRLLCD